jgi:N-acetyl-anhydromuramyl-L-alanine amidase AmpD
MDNNPKCVILHCSASPDSREVRFDFEACRKFHKEERKWRDIGYHVYIDRSGKVSQGRPYNMVGAHAKGHNQNSIGVCYEGSYFPTIEQINALCDVYRNIKAVYGIDYKRWHGHYEFANKECPGFMIEEARTLFAKLSG